MEHKQLVKRRQGWLLPLILLITGLAVGAGLTTALRGNDTPAVSVQGVVSRTGNPGTGPTAQELYDAAVKDAVFADPDEIMPLVSLNKQDARATWNEAGDRVLLLTWHNYPDSYPAGQEVSLKWGKVWAFTENEIKERYTAEAGTVTDWDMRLKQLIGFPPDSQHSTITGFWVRPEDVCRPAYETDPTLDRMAVTFSKDVDPDYKEWFDGNIIWSYFDSAYPWTRLGYTYDWADNGREYGMTEFLVNQDAQVQVEFTESTQAFLSSLGEGTN